MPNSIPCTMPPDDDDIGDVIANNANAGAYQIPGRYSLRQYMEDRLAIREKRLVEVSEYYPPQNFERERAWLEGGICELNIILRAMEEMEK